MTIKGPGWEWVIKKFISCHFRSKKEQSQGLPKCLSNLKTWLKSKSKIMSKRVNNSGVKRNKNEREENGVKNCTCQKWYFPSFRSQRKKELSQKKRLLSETNWNRYLKNLHLVEKLWIELLIQWVFSKNTVYLPMKFCDARIKLQVLILDLCIYLMSFLVDLSMWWNGRNMHHTRVWHLRKRPRVLSRDVLIIINK